MARAQHLFHVSFYSLHLFSKAPQKYQRFSPRVLHESGDGSLMVTTARRLGETPTLVERVLMLERIVAEQAEVIAAQGARIAALEDQRGAGDEEDGLAPAPLPANWQPLKKAASIAGYSWLGLRKKITTRRDGPWWRRRGNRILVDVTAMPRKAV
jgi:hypothetical protein